MNIQTIIKSTFTRSNPFELIADDHHGQYCAQVFAECIKRELFPDVSAETWAILEAGPDHEEYTETASEIGYSSEWEGVDGIRVEWMEGAIWVLDPSWIASDDDPNEWTDDLYENRPAELRRRVAEAHWNLMEGNGGDFSDENLTAIRDQLDAYCDGFLDGIPMYIWGDFGIEEIDFDPETALMGEWQALKDISGYL